MSSEYGTYTQSISVLVYSVCKVRACLIKVHCSFYFSPGQRFADKATVVSVFSEDISLRLSREKFDTEFIPSAARLKKKPAIVVELILKKFRFGITTPPFCLVFKGLFETQWAVRLISLFLFGDDLLVLNGIVFSF